MEPKNLKSGMGVHLTIEDVSFKTEVGRQPKKNDLQKIKLPLEWKNAVKDFGVGSECLLSYQDDKKACMQVKMILMEKNLDQNDPFILLKPYTEEKKRCELRKHTRIKAFIFAIISKKEGAKGEEIEDGDAINGTISDVSLEGCMLMSDHSFKANQNIRLVFDLSDEEPAVKIKCQIMNQRKSHIEECFFYGLKFKELGAYEQKIITSLIDEINTQNSK